MNKKLRHIKLNDIIYINGRYGSYKGTYQEFLNLILKKAYGDKEDINFNLELLKKDLHKQLLKID